MAQADDGDLLRQQAALGVIGQRPTELRENAAAALAEPAGPAYSRPETASRSFENSGGPQTLPFCRSRCWLRRSLTGGERSFAATYRDGEVAPNAAVPWHPIKLAGST